MKIIVRSGNMICEVPVEKGSDIVVQGDTDQVLRIYVRENGTLYVSKQIPDWAKEKLKS